MNLEELRSVQDAERRKSDLQPLRESFYAEAGEYIADLKTERERAAERADDPFSSTEVRQITDEIETAEDVLESIYERRMGKLLKRASLSAADMSVDEEGLTAEEQELFDDLVDRITRNKERVLETLAGESGSRSPSPADDPAPERDRHRRSTAEPEPPVESPADGGSPATGGESTGTDAARRTEDPGSTPEPRSAVSDASPDAVEGSSGPVGGSNPETVDAAGAMGSGGSGAGQGDGGEAAGTPTRHEVEPEPAPEAVTGGPPPESREDPGTDPGDGGGSRRGIGTDRDGTGAGGDAAGPDDTDRVVVRITDEVGAIYGVDDREYDLSSEDVVTLPSQNAEPLVQRGAAERLE